MKSSMTPGGSAWGDSIAGKSIVSSQKNALGGAKTAASTTSRSGAFDLLPESLGVEKWNDALAPLRDVRNKLDEKVKSNKKRRRKGKGKKSALKFAGTQSEIDDATSAYTGYTSEQTGLIDEKDKILEDFFPHQGKPRDFFKVTFYENPKANQSITPVLTLLEIDDYDEIKQAERLYVNVRKTMDLCKVTWKTINVERIKELIRFCIIREIN